MKDFKELAFGLLRLVLSMILLVQGLVLLAFINYVSMAGSMYSTRIDKTHEASYDTAFFKSYDAGYHAAHDKAHDSGYDRAYEIGMEPNGSERGTLVELNNPTHKEMRDFLTKDETDFNPYIASEYICSDFAADLVHKADAVGIRAAYVRIRATDWGHALVAFDTVDSGIIFVDPQSDKEVILTVGKPYPWYLIGATSPLEYYEPITEIQIIW
ncbi:hypothetical protein ACFLXP_01465 [Chloroflexota bacterium]